MDDTQLQKPVQINAFRQTASFRLPRQTQTDGGIMGVFFLMLCYKHVLVSALADSGKRGWYNGANLRYIYVQPIRTYAFFLAIGGVGGITGFECIFVYLYTASRRCLTKKLTLNMRNRAFWLTKYPLLDEK